MGNITLTLLSSDGSELLHLDIESISIEFEVVGPTWRSVIPPITRELSLQVDIEDPLPVLLGLGAVQTDTADHVDNWLNSGEEA